MIPHSKRDRRRSSKVAISRGCLSEEMTICFFASWSSLNVWKNSSWVLSFPIINWISSIKRTSLFLYFSRNSEFFWFFTESISSLVNVSDVTYKTLSSGLVLIIKCAIACIRWVLPSPAPPYMNRGLYICPGVSATASDAAWARLLLVPITNVSNV